MQSMLRILVLVCVTALCAALQPAPVVTAAPVTAAAPAASCAVPVAGGFTAEGDAGQMSCADGCAADRESCLASGVCGTQIYCETCENQYNACLAACNSSGGGPCPTTTTATDHDTFTWFPHDYVCVGFGVTGSLYRKAQVTMKTTVTTTTRQCNGSTSQQTNVTYNDLYCYYYDTGQTCYSPPYPFVPACS